MKIAISAIGNNLDCQVDSRFGRCAYFIVVETDDMSFEAFDNMSSAQSGGAGTQAAGFVASLGVRCVLTGNCGPKAAAVFSSAGIDVYTGQQGVVRDVVENFKKGQISVTASAGKSAKSSPRLASEIPAGAGASFGRGMGMGGGRRCKGGGRGMGFSGIRAVNPPRATKEENLEQLKQQARALKQELEVLQSRIKELE